MADKSNFAPSFAIARLFKKTGAPHGKPQAHDAFAKMADLSHVKPKKKPQDDKLKG